MCKWETNNGYCMLPLQSRNISPPRRTVNRNSVDLSRIDPAHYSGGSFLMLAFKNAQCNPLCFSLSFKFSWSTSKTGTDIDVHVHLAEMFYLGYIKLTLAILVLCRRSRLFLPTCISVHVGSFRGRSCSELERRGIWFPWKWVQLDFGMAEHVSSWQCSRHEYAGLVREQLWIWGRGRGAEYLRPRIGFRRFQSSHKSESGEEATSPDSVHGTSTHAWSLCNWWIERNVGRRPRVHMWFG
jgi:hypothetical protein